MVDQKQQRFVVEEPRRFALTRHTLVLIRTLLFLYLFLEGLCKLTPKYSEDTFNARTKLYKHIFTPLYQEWFFTRLGIYDVNPVKFRDFIGSLELIFAMGLFTPAKRLAALLTCVMMSCTYMIYTHMGWHPLLPCVLGTLSFIVLLMGKGPTKKIWLSSEPPPQSVKSKKED